MKTIFYRFLFLTISLSIVAGCQEESSTLFTRLQASETGIDFNNKLTEDNPDFSILNYPYFYNGGGVAVGDINNDGLPDILFTGNMVKNKLFLNKGNLQFTDVSENSGILENSGWSTGATMVDINEDGWLDMYVCRSGLPNPADRTNLLYINNHDLTFTESAGKKGLDDPGYSTQASFFDYDNDGDLDMFLINQSDPKYAIGYVDYLQTRTQKADSALANKLYRNDEGHFVDASHEAGISSTVFTFSLGISTSDINQDGWPDIYVANDFEEADYLYINNQDGTFSNGLSHGMDHTSLFSMGMDVADYNNDLLPDILVADMLPEDNYAQKMHISGDNFNRYNYLFGNGMFPQFMKNTLQKNNGDGTFSEIGQLAGISNTDWSWSPLVADFDNDGLKDIFITNGYKRDNTDMDFMGYAMDESLRAQKGGSAVKVAEYISHMPGIHLPNYVFKNEGNDRFSNKVKDWGFDHSTFSHGGAYADLDNDGDLDLVTNNTESDAGVYRNNGEKLSVNTFLKIKLRGSKQNSTGIGARIYVYAGKDRFYLEQTPVRGYQSSVNHDLVLGLGQNQLVDSMRIIWPGHRSQLTTNTAVNTSLVFSYSDAEKINPPVSVMVPLLHEVNLLPFTHIENVENDFARQFLLPHFFSHNGPCLIQGDVNGDGLSDIFVGGAKGQASAIFLQSRDLSYTKLPTPALDLDAGSEDVDGAFFDVDGDADLDLYVVSGGYEFEEGSPFLQDRLYLNNGKGLFSKSYGSLPDNTSNKKCVRPIDIDGDGDTDLFVGGSVVSGKYPHSTPSKIYFNDGKGNFSNTKPANAPLGIVNDALWVDLNLDGKKDLIVASEWQPVKVYQTDGALFTDVSAQWFPLQETGLWNCLASGDFDNDGDMDLIVGNYGLNSPLRADEQHPLGLHYGDFDGNGSVDPLMTHYIQNESVPLPMRDDLIGQIPAMKKQFNGYKIYAKATIHEILSPEQIAQAPFLKTNILNTIYLENTGTTFVKRALPIEAQFSTVYAIAVADLNEDGHPDLVIAGNNKMNRIYLGQQDANHGMVLLGDGKGNFRYLPQTKSGLNVRGDVRSISTVANGLLFGVNNAPVKHYQFTGKK